MNIFDMCTNPDILLVFLFLKYAFNIVCILLPLIIMYRVFVPLFKTVISGNGLDKEVSSMIKSFLAALIVFLIPSIFTFIFTNLIDLSTSGISICFVNSDINKINEYRKLNEEQRKKEAARIKEELKEAAKKNHNTLLEHNKDVLEAKKDKEEQERLEEQNNNGGSVINGNDDFTGSTNNSGGSGFKTAIKNIIIGDSRTVGMCAAKTDDWINCQYSNGGPKYSGDDIYIAEGSKGYSWFNSTAVPAVNSIINSNPGTTYNIYSLMGVNFLLSDIDKYTAKYSVLSTGSWKNHNIILVSVNPVDEVKEKKYGYSTKNSDIISFNNKLQTVSGSNIKYCNTYSSVLSSLSASDGLHYNSSSYLVVYDTMISCGG